MPFDDLADESDETNPGDEALDELAGTLTDDSTAETDATGDEAESAEHSEKSAYDSQTEPAFPTAKTQTQHSVYCLPETWDAVDGASGLLFEAEITLRRDGYEAVQKRELHNALLQAAAQQLTATDIADAFVATREDRTAGSLLDDDS
ncbi:hypothetical protein [Natronorubrum thiooxidans]|uniref:Uncharacterized protein n=1 Tax=Natronorubrum thiooxidans TaxID=308853 RepID=A0A1N7H3Q5_9EURY|nr:hypothetical protein [Natronorubrum thiooxidans]SIS19446.1 hypothetical protein SAMN05421752_1232 [Natronorubrum thiooxidans]